MTETCAETDIILLAFVHSHRERDEYFQDIEYLQQLTFLFFALDNHLNYSRWVSVQLLDMQVLSDKLTDHVSKLWVIQETSRKLFVIPM